GDASVTRYVSRFLVSPIREWRTFSPAQCSLVTHALQARARRLKIGLAFGKTHSNLQLTRYLDEKVAREYRSRPVLGRVSLSYRRYPCSPGPLPRLAGFRPDLPLTRSVPLHRTRPWRRAPRYAARGRYPAGPDE